MLILLIWNFIKDTVLDAVQNLSQNVRGKAAIWLPMCCNG